MSTHLVHLELTSQQAASLLAAAEWVYGSTLIQGFAVPGCSRLMLLRSIAGLTDACLQVDPELAEERENVGRGDEGDRV